VKGLLTCLGCKKSLAPFAKQFVQNRSGLKNLLETFKAYIRTIGGEPEKSEATGCPEESEVDSNNSLQESL
jgi:hypothetical protein